MYFGICVSSPKHIVNVIPDGVLANFSEAALLFLWRTLSICMVYNVVFHMI